MTSARQRRYDAVLCAEVNLIATSRIFSVGITGHRPNRLMAPQSVTVSLNTVLALIKAQAAACDLIPVLISALAEGADRLAAKAALAAGVRLDVILPFASGEYEMDFESAESKAEYRGLLEKAFAIVSLSGNPKQRDTAYQAAGLKILERSNLLIAVWDGGPPAGIGGTPEMIAAAAKIGLRTILLDATGNKTPAVAGGGDIANCVMQAIRVCFNATS